MRPQRFVEDHTLISTALPALRVRVGPDFRYLGKHEFTIEDIAAGERHIFVVAPAQQVTRVFIAQFEGYLPSSAGLYRYSFDGAPVIAGYPFGEGAYAFSNRAEEQEYPTREAAGTVAFLRSQGLAVADEWMMARFFTVADATRRHELILFYIENVRDTGHTLAEFYQGEDKTPLWAGIAAGLMARARQNFQILPGP